MNLYEWYKIIKIKNPMLAVLSYMIAGVESNYKHDAVGDVGELGYFQIRPEYYPILREDLSAETQAKVFVDFMNKNSGYLQDNGIMVNWENLLRVWNGGLGGMFSDQVNDYIKKYRKSYWWFK